MPTIHVIIDDQTVTSKINIDIEVEQRNILSPKRFKGVEWDKKN